MTLDQLRFAALNSVALGYYRIDAKVSKTFQ